jgi:tetratricopeptide (TPR) repeat protein
VELQGPLWEGVLPVVLRRIYVRRRTGELTLRYEREVRRVLFHGGNITNAATNVREDRMGELLVRQGRLSEADLKRATGFVLRDSKRLGAVLVDLGILNQATLREVAAAHVDTVLSRALSWSDGEYDFREVSDRPTGEEEATLPYSTGDLILRASRAVQDPDVVRYNLGDIDRVVSLSSDPLLRFQRLNLTAEDWLVVSAASGSLTARQIVERIALKREEARLSLFALLNTGIIEYPDRTGSFPSLLEKRPASPPSPAADAPGGVDRTQPLPQVPLPAEPTMRMDALEPPEALRGEPTIVLRREDLQALLAGKLPEAPKVSLPLPDLAPPLEPTVVLSREELSSAMALDSRRRDIVDKHSSLGRCTHFEVLGISRDASDAVIREAYFRLAKRFHPDSHHDVGLGDLRQELEAVFNELGEAYEVLRSPRLRARYERELAGGEAGAPAPTEIGDPEAALARAADCIARERHWEALPLLEATLPRVEGAARQRARVLLAQIYARDPDWVKQAQELLLAVVEQEPQHAEAHYYLGVIYRYQGLPSRALASFRKVVEITPDSADAWRTIAELDKQSVVPPEIALLLRKLLRRE